MARTRRCNRRSFLAQVVGGGLGIGALATIGAARAQEGLRRMAIDSDPNDPARPRNSPYDADAGAAADSPEVVRVRPSGLTDTDTGAGADPANRGRHGRTGSRGTTDSDSGANADAAGQGRGGGRAPPAAAPGGSAQPEPPQAATQAPLDSFVICPGHPRCPQ
jgi:hypothetical protein